MAVKADRKKLMKKYISGGYSYASLARENKISESTIKRWAREDGWGEKKAEADAKAAQKMVDSAVEDKTGVVAGVVEIANQLLRKLATALEQEPEEMEPARFRQYTGALRDIQEITGERCKLDEKEQKARIAKMQQDAKRVKADTERTQADTERTKAQTEKTKREIEAKLPENNGICVELMGETEQYGV